MARIFENLTIKDMTVKNRIVMPPMCMYSAEKDGYAKGFHLAHYTARAIGGVGLIILEATAVEPEGRISDRDLGIWEDEQVTGLKEIVDSGHQYGSKMGIQLGHAGRKSTVDYMDSYAPSAIAFSDKLQTPKEMTIEDIKRVVKQFGKAAKRARQAGFDLIEIHGAHGYLINEFLSPLTNHREDEYGGEVGNRARLLKEIIQEVRKEWPEKKPLQVRVSAVEYEEGGNEALDLAGIINSVKEEGVDMVNVSTGGVVLTEMDVYPGYQIKHGEVIKDKTGLVTAVGGLIQDPSMVEEILNNQRGDMVYLGRALLRDPHWVYQAAETLQVPIAFPFQYERAYR
jgi:NADPH2 dehydrogenase